MADPQTIDNTVVCGFFLCFFALACIAFLHLCLPSFTLILMSQLQLSVLFYYENIAFIE